jgi:hypothetical protein
MHNKNKQHAHTLLALALAVTASFTGFVRAADHTAEIEVSVSRGAVGCHFSIWQGNKQGTIDGVTFNIPFTSRFTKITARDDSTNPRRVTPQNPWNTKVTFSGGGRFIFDISDWDGNPAVNVVIKIDGNIYFKGSGDRGNFDQWTDKYYRPGVRKTDDREIAFDLP